MSIHRSPISVVIPTYNGQQLLESHLSFIEAQLDNGDELIIVDDASQDDTVEWLKQRYHLHVVDTSLPSSSDHSKQRAVPIEMVREYRSATTVAPNIRLLSLTQNQRFARAVNTGVLLAQHNLVGLFNNDVKLLPNCLDQLASHFAATETDRSVTIDTKQRSDRSAPQATTASVSESVAAEIDNSHSLFAVGSLEVEDDAGLQGGKNLLWFKRGLFQHSRASEFGSGSTAWASGGSCMVDRSKWVELGGFDPAYYPAYWEDTDIAFRARQRGWQVLFDSQAQVVHHHESTNTDVFGSADIAKLSYQHQRFFTRTHANHWQLVQYYLWQPYWAWKMRRLV